MHDLTEYLFDTSFFNEVIAYLDSVHAIQAQVVTSRKKPLPSKESAPAAAGVSRLFPFTAPGELAGLLCTAESEACLDQAEPHITICLSGINQLLWRETELQQAASEMLELSEQLHFLFRLAGKIIGITNLQEFCTAVLQEVGRAIEADYALVKAPALWKENVTVNWQVSNVRVKELEQLNFLPKEASERTMIFSLADSTSTLTAPIRGKEGTVGYMAFFRNQGSRPFTAYQKKFVSIIENIYSPTIETIRLYDSLQELYLNTVKALAAAIDAKDEYTHGHSFRVARYSMSIGRYMQISERKLADLEIAAYMHDLGKIGVPEAILVKPGKLTEAEFLEIKKHPVFTDKILQPINLPAFIVAAAVHHHERLDGSGYPHGLRGDQISLYARIIAVADVFDALTSERPYRPAMSVEDSLKILCEGIDTKFDRQVVLALLSALRAEQVDSVLADDHIHLEFAEIHHLNNFLVELIDFLLPEGTMNKRLGPPVET
jgi:HD-GYP domain-containing protein (c-di-GMP phosphodiesterase class II)